jgi:hypothetical protein
MSLYFSEIKQNIFVLKKCFVLLQRFFRQD